MNHERWDWRVWSMRAVLVESTGGRSCVHVHDFQYMRGLVLGREELRFLVGRIFCRRHGQLSRFI